MGYILEPTPEMGEYSAEVRSESFYLRGGRDSITMYPWPTSQGVTPQHGTIELLLADLPKIRAALDAVESHLAVSGRE